MLPQIVVSLLVGVVIVVALGIGVHAFYLPPSQSSAKLQKLDSEQKALDTSRRLLGAKSGTHEAFYKKLSASIAAERTAVQAGRNGWVRNTSIILAALGTLVMVVSLAPVKRRHALSNGMLLGGFLTLLYGVVSSFAGGASGLSYVLVAVALVVTIAFGYIRFVRLAKADRKVSGLPEPPPFAPPAE